MNLKINLLLCAVSNLVQPINSDVLIIPNMGADCISVFQIIKGIQILCDNKNNATLWQHAIDCHAPISEQFLRESGEAQCPVPKVVENPTDTYFSIQEVFFNICGLVQGNTSEIMTGVRCMLFGKENVKSHFKEVDRVKARWGPTVPCRIGECILAMGLELK